MQIKQFFFSLFHNPPKGGWKPSVTAYNEAIKDRAKVEFLYKNVQDKLQATVDSHTFVEKKIVVLLSYIISVNTVIIGYMVGKNNDNMGLIDHIISSGWQFSLIFIILSLMAVMLIWVLKPKKFHMRGNDAQNLIEAEYCTHDINSMILGEAINYKERVDYNQYIVQRNSSILNWFLFVIVILPMLFLL